MSIQMTQLEGGLRSSGGAHIERMRKAADSERVRREVNWAAVNAANEKAAQSRQQGEALWASLEEAGYTLVSSWRWGQEHFMPTFQEVALMEKATSNKEAAILACKEHAASEYGSFEVEQVINLTQHSATVEQTESGVVEPKEKAAVQAALTFDAIPSAEEMAQRAEFLAAIAKESDCVKAMIGGAPFFMSALERALKAHGIVPIYAFSQRESVETIKEDGSVIKTNVFKHVGFVGA